MLTSKRNIIMTMLLFTKQHTPSHIHTHTHTHIHTHPHSLVPDVPMVTVTALSSTQVGVTWTTLPNSIITEHIIYLGGIEAGRSQGSEFTVTMLEPFTEYVLSVSASNEAGEGGQSTGETVRTLEDSKFWDFFFDYFLYLF